jgi:hypothetical protein
MANGHDQGQVNLAAFNAWKTAKSDDDFRQLVLRGQLSRKEICAECGFGRSAINQNPGIKAALQELEDGLRERGVLPEKAAKADEGMPQRDTGGRKAALNANRLKAVEEENASLRAENDQLKSQLQSYGLLHEALTETGRIPRVARYNNDQ